MHPMASSEVQRFVVPFLTWLLAGALSLGTFIVWARDPKSMNQETGLWIGGLACLVSLCALTEVIRRAINPKALLVSILLYVFGFLVAFGITFVYALFFSVFHSKDF